MEVVKIGLESTTYADKQATLKYAAWVSEDFEDMVYAAFEAVLAMPEVAAVVANKMVEHGHLAEAEALEAHSEENADRDFAYRQLKALQPKTTNKQLYMSVLRGYLSLSQADAQGFKGVWRKRCMLSLGL